ncbi:MAG: hypothetical protein WCK18_17260 [Prolixibacteraceae bacterium]
MKKLLLIFSLLLVVAILFVQCKSCGCTYQPKAAKKTHTWQKH